MNKSPDNQTKSFDLEKTKAILVPDIFSNGILKKFCKQPNQVWNKLTRIIFRNLELPPTERQLDVIKGLSEELIDKLNQNLKSIKKIKNNEEKKIKQSEFAKSFANRVSIALTELKIPMEELGLLDFINELYANTFQLDPANSNPRYHIWEMMIIKCRPKGTGRITPLENGRVSVTSSLTIPPSKIEAADSLSKVIAQKNETKKSAEEILAMHLFYKPSAKKAAEPAVPHFELIFEEKLPQQLPDLIFKDNITAANQAVPAKKTINKKPVTAPAQKNAAPKKSPNSALRTITRWAAIGATAAAAIIGITKARDGHAIPYATENTASSATPSTSAVDLEIDIPEPTAAPVASPVTSFTGYRQEASSPAPAIASATASAPVKTVQPAPVAQNTAAENSSTAASAPASAGHYGFDTSFEKFSKYKETYFKQSLFSTALDYAAANADVELSGKESKAEAKLVFYKSFLEAGMKEYAHNGAVRIFFTERLRHLGSLMDKIHKGEFNPEKDMPFAGLENIEDRLLWNAVSQPILKPKVNPNVRYMVENDINKNPYLATALESIKDVTGLRNVIKEAVTKISCPVKEQPAFNECAYETMFKIAGEHKAKDPSNGTAGLLTTLHNQDKSNRTTFVGKILRVKKEIPVAAQLEKPAITNIVAPDKTPDADTSALPESGSSTTPATETPAAPIHSMAAPEFNDQDQNWFSEGRDISAQNEKEAEDNRKWVAAYPEWFPDEQKPERPGYLARAAKFIKNVFSPAPKTAEELEQAELKRSIPKKSFWRNLIG